MENKKQNDDDGQTLVEQPVADAETAVTAVPGDSPAPTATATSSSSAEKTEEEIERRRKRKEAHRRHRRERELQKQKIEEAERLRINYLQDPRKRIGRDYEQWQAGQTVQTPEAQQKLTILRRIDDGHAGVVFKVRDEAGSMLALKVPRSESEKQFKKLHQEVAKNARMQSLGLPVAEITEEGGDYLVKRWIDGLRGDHWFIQWNEKGRPLDDLAWRRLCEMFDMLAAKNIYVQNLKDLNMIWDGHKWVVIDVGYFKGGLTPQQALGRYYETFDGRWNKPRYNRGRFMFLCPTIAALRGHSHPQHYIKRESARTAYQRGGFTSKSKTSTAEGDASGSGELLLPRIDATNGGGGPMSPLLPGTKVGGLGASNGGSSDAMNDIKRKQAEAAMAVLERANRKKKKKQRQAAAAASGGGSKESDVVEGGAAAAAATTTTTTAAVTTTVKDESGAEEKTKKRSAKDEEKEKKELKGKKEKELKEKKEKKEKELREKRDQKEKEKKEKEQKKKK